MAETVKKSRIVSDDTLEESLMEEFNQRLKSCQDDLQNPLEEVPTPNSTLEAFLLAEQTNVYDVPKPTNGHIRPIPDDANLYEEIDSPSVVLTEVSETAPNPPDTNKSIKDRMLLSTDALLFTQTVTSPMITPSEENIDFLKGFHQSPPELTTDLDQEPIREENLYENTEFLKQNANTEEIHLYENITEIQEKIAQSEQLKSIEVLKQINQFENEESTQVTESYVETTTTMESSEKGLKKKKTKKSRKEEKENISVSDTDGAFRYNVNVKDLCRSFGDLTKLDERHQPNPLRTRDKFCCFGHNNVLGERELKKSSFNKFDALQKKIHVRSSDSSNAQEKFNGASQITENSNCKACDKAVFQMEQIKAEKSIWHKNCFRCNECNKQLNVDTYQSHEGTVYCKPHFKALFAPKAVEDNEPAPKPRRAELIIRENQPMELPADVVRASDKPDLGLEELQSLNVKERFQVFEQHHSSIIGDFERAPSSVKRSPSILSKLARFQAKGMDIGVADDSLNGIPIEESSSEEDEDVGEEENDGEDADLIRAKRVQKEKPFHFTGMSDVKNRWEQGEQNSGRDERREERKQEIQSIRNRLFMGKQGKMKEAYQQAVMESESCTNLAKEKIEVCDTKSLKERFEKGESISYISGDKPRDEDSEEVYESELSKSSRSLFLELDANASKAPQVTAPTTPRVEVKRAREAYLSRVDADDVVKSSVEQTEDVQIKTADIQQRFNFFETYSEPERARKTFRITPPRDGQVKVATPEREVYRDPEVIRSEEIVEDSVIAKQSHTATKMLNKFRQMEEDHSRDSAPAGPKPLKCFTPPPEPVRAESSNDESESEVSEEEADQPDRAIDDDLIEAQKAARAQKLRAKFEKWEANEIQKEQSNGTINIVEELGDEQSQVESTKSLRARFELMKDTSSDTNRMPRVKVNRFVELPTEICESCKYKVYPLEKISVHNHIYHKSCFKCRQCNCVLRMDSYSYNQGLLYCTPHFKRLFISKGNYDTAFGLGEHKEKWNNTPVIKL